MYLEKAIPVFGSSYLNTYFCCQKMCFSPLFQLRVFIFIPNPPRAPNPF